MKKIYRKFVDNNNFTGSKRKSCKFFEELDIILGVKPVTKPSLEINSETGLQSDLQIMKRMMKKLHLYQILKR